MFLYKLNKMYVINKSHKFINKNYRYINISLPTESTQTVTTIITSLELTRIHKKIVWYTQLESKRK